MGRGHNELNQIIFKLLEFLLFVNYFSCYISNKIF